MPFICSAINAFFWPSVFWRSSFFHEAPAGSGDTDFVADGSPDMVVFG
jgi:hypothetical protein